MDAAGHKAMNQAARYAHLSPQHTRSVVDRIAGTNAAEPNMHQNVHQHSPALKKN
jgi:ribosomal protein L22